jgi:hypothetical protein
MARRSQYCPRFWQRFSRVLAASTGEEAGVPRTLVVIDARRARTERVGSVSFLGVWVRWGTLGSERGRG